MRVIVLSDAAYVAGGAEKVALLSAIGLANRGYKVDLLASLGPKASFLDGIENLRVWSLEQKTIDDAPSKISGFRRQIWNPEAAAAMREIVADADPKDTVVHAHTYLRMLSPAPVGIALDRGLKTVLTLNDYGLACPSRVFYNHAKAEVCRLKPMSLACLTTECTGRSWVRKGAMVARTLSQDYLARVGKRVDGYICVSQFSQEIFEPYMRPDKPRTIVYNLSDIPPQECVDAGANSGLVWVGRLVAEKDPVFLAKVAKERNVPVTFVGEGPEREAILAANPDAKITGWVETSEVQKAIRSARALVMTSRWYECAPLVIQDAMARGVPVIMSNLCAGVEFVIDGVTGYSYQGGDEASLGARLDLLKDDNHVTEMGRNAYASYWNGGWDEETHCAKLLTFYQQVLGDSGA